MLRYYEITTPTHGNRISVMAYGPERPTTKPPVYLVHPINLRKEFWLDVMRELAVDRICYAADSAGHGESSDSQAYGIEVWVRDHVEVIEALGLDHLHLVGGSLGGAIIVGIAAELPARVLSSAAFGSLVKPAENDADADPPDLLTMLTERGRDAVFYDVAVAATAPGTAQDIVETVWHLTNTHVDQLSAIWAATIVSDARRWASDVKCPALVVNGQYDVTCTPAMGRILAAAIGGRFVELPGAGHLPAIEDPTATLGLLVPHIVAAEA